MKHRTFSLTLNFSHVKLNLLTMALSQEGACLSKQIVLIEQKMGKYYENCFLGL